MLKVLRWAAAFAVSVLFVGSTAVQATVIAYDLSFETAGQSIWDTGNSFTLDQSVFLGAAWEDQRVNLDLIAGDASTSIPNPLRAAYDVAFAACDLLFSASVCISGQAGQVGVVALGNRPSVRSCGRWAVACHIARGADFARRAAYDVAFAACDAAFPASACRNGRPTILPVAALGTAPPSDFDVDTRTGVAVEGNTDGRVGLELGIEIDSGSVDATVSYQATMNIPDTTLLTPGDAINFNPNSELAGTNALNTSFSNLSMSVDAIMELSGSVTAEGCLIGPGCATAGGPFDIAERASILSFNEDGEGGIEVLGLPPSALGLPIPAGFPVSFDVAGFVEATIHLPAPDASGGLDTTTGTLKATGQDDLLDLIVDLDNIVATAAGVPGLFGSSIDLAGFGSVFFDIINVAMGPTIDLKQDFELDPTLLVEFLFDQAVMVGGELVTSLTSAWDLLPDISFLADVTTVTPTFFVDASLQNDTLLDFDLQFFIDLLQIGFDLPVVGEHMIGIGNVLDRAVDLFESPNLYEKMFPLGGFNALLGESFVIDFISGSAGPTNTGTRALANSAPDPAAVPEPATIFMLFAGLFILYGLRRRDRKNSPVLLLPRDRPLSVA